MILDGATEPLPLPVVVVAAAGVWHEDVVEREIRCRI